MKQIATITGENLNVVVKNVETASTSAAAHKKTKAEQRMDALRALGYDMSKYFTLGDEQVVEIKDGKAVPVEFVQIAPDEDDMVEKKLVEGGYVNNWSLFRRWVMSQMFHMLRDMEERHWSFNETLQHRGYEYQWKMLEREIYAQMKMQKHGDRDNAARRSMWFNGMTAHYMAVDYVMQLKKYINDNLVYRRNHKGELKYKHTCKGNAYVRLSNANIFVSDLEKKMYAPLMDLAITMRGASSAEALYKTVHKFNKIRKHLAARTKQSMEFINAYKGSGAYFTMRNLIMFHGARFTKAGQFMSREMSLLELDRKASGCIADDEKWRMLGILKQLIKDNGISVNGKINEWKND